jgi:cation diffusion facilitator CzcD-associated flavoprotein CzcO
MRWNRFWTYFNVDALFVEYVNLPQSDALRNTSQKEAYDYMVKTAPKKYLEQLIPDYPVGCKRRVLDPGYLASLHRDNVILESRKIDHINEEGIVLEDGSSSTYDAIVYATGFKTQSFLAPMEIVGQGGQSLNDHWQETGGCQAYHGTTVSGFPNLAILFGPNASPAHNSVIYSVEVQVEYVIKTFFEPLLSKRANAIAVKRSAEDYDCNLIQLGLKNSVWHSGCTNWTLNEFGRNCSNFPGYVRSFWWKLYSPKWKDYTLKVSQ